MKRTNLVLDEKLLIETTRLLGAKTYSAAVNKAMEETILCGLPDRHDCNPKPPDRVAR